MQLDTARHELVCSGCGAPLHNIKKLPSDKVGKGHHDLVGHTGHAVPKKSKRKKRQKSFGRRFFDELIDVVEDLID